ncbi:MAG TPA: hypothetical protein VM029_12120 [Opitutaceae bacterium]|nr:hypothetical protein [Opitutaceae bacterium]
MPLQLSPQEAAAALADVADARAAMRQAIRAHRGHLHLWIWGAAWIAMPLSAHVWGDHVAVYFSAICLVAGVLSGITGFTQSRQLRMPANVRFLGIIATLVVFAALFPFVLRAPPDVRTIYAYMSLVAMQAYVIAGLWTDSYLLWLGILVTALILAGVILFPAIFWLWMAIFGGGTLVASGFYVRHCWH